MRLWHEALIPYLPRQQLLGQHRECCALRGLGWGRKHATVDYVFTHPYAWLPLYHAMVMREMERRGYNVSKEWQSVVYRGKRLGNPPSNKWTEIIVGAVDRAYECTDKNCTIYPEHDDAYLQECLENLAAKGIKIDMEEQHG